MISYLKGKPLIQSDKVIILTKNDVGYGVYLGTKVRAWITQKEQVELYIYTHVRDDALELYGFRSQEQQHLFELMISVSGVGPKTALEIVDNDPAKIVEAVQQSQINFFKQVKRVGKKTAQKIILELKSKLGSIKELSLGPRSNKEQDVYETLIALGYDEGEIADLVSQIEIDELSTEQAVKKALKLMASHN